MLIPLTLLCLASDFLGTITTFVLAVPHKSSSNPPVVLEFPTNGAHVFSRHPHLNWSTSFDVPTAVSDVPVLALCFVTFSLISFVVLVLGNSYFLRTNCSVCFDLQETLVQVATSPAFTPHTLVVNDAVSSVLSRYAVCQSQLSPGTYWWRVRVHQEDWSAASNFVSYCNLATMRCSE